MEKKKMNNKKNNFNPPKPDVIRNYDLNTEYGRVGHHKYGGVFFEEFEERLRGKKGIEVFKEMAENDDIIGAIFFAIKMLIRQTSFKIETEGETEADIKALDFVKSCLDDMDHTWQDTISEMLSFLIYGWSWHEIVYKYRMGDNEDPKLKSKYNDGLIGWRKLPLRSQDTLWKWEYDETDELIGMSQMAPPDFSIRTIPKSKSIHLVTESQKANPEGKSILRNAYRSYYFKKRMQEIEGIGVERDLAGLPVITPPEGVDIWDTTDIDCRNALAYAEKLVQNIRRDSVEGIVKPFGWNLELLNGGSKRQFEVGNIIERYDNRMAMTVLADFILLGHQSAKGYVLSSDKAELFSAKTDLFSSALGTFLEVICDAFNSQAIPQLIKINRASFDGLTKFPKLKHGDIKKQNITELAAYIEKMTGIGLLVPEENLSKYVREMANLPEPARQTKPKQEKSIEIKKSGIKESIGQGAPINENTLRRKLKGFVQKLGR